MAQLTTARLVLREFAEDDWPALHEIESRPEVARYQTFEPRTLEESRAYVVEACEQAADDPRRHLRPGGGPRRPRIG